MRWALAGLVFSGWLCGQAAAQQPSSEIVVVGERRPQSLKTATSNVATLDADAIDRIGAQAASEVLNRLPGVNFHRGSGVENLPAIRSPVLTGGQGAGSFLILEDGVPIRAPGFANINQIFETNLEFADRIEVVRGPGSALYGSNAVHGIVNIMTEASPRPRAEAFAGSFGRYGGALRGSVSGFGLNVSALHEDGWREEAGLDTQHVLGAMEGGWGEWTASARLTFVNLNQETAGFVGGTDAYRDEALARSNENPEAFRDTKTARAQVRLERPLGQEWSVQLTPFARWIEADLLLHFFPSKALEETAQAGGGLQSAFYWDPSETLSVILGADVDQTRGTLRETQALPDIGSFPQGLHYDYSVDANVLAAFAQARWAFAPGWLATGGLRAERVRYVYDNKAPDGDFGRFRRAADRDDDFSILTPKLGVARDWGEGSVWLNYARGARAPQTTDLYSLQTGQAPGGQDPETTDSVEIGYRGPVGPASVEIALYHLDKRDGAFRNADGFTITGAETRHRGVEISGSVPITETMRASGWWTFADHEYRFSDPVGRAGESIRSGDSVDSAPRTLWQARLTWSPSPALEAEAAWIHVGPYFTNAENTRIYRGHDVADLRAAWTFGNWGLNAAVRNVFDTRYAERADFAFGEDRYFPGEGRAVTIGVSIGGQ